MTARQTVPLLAGGLAIAILCGSPLRAAPPPPRPDLPPEQRAILVVDGKERVVDAAEARAAGYTLVDLGDRWTPFIFNDSLDDQGQAQANRYAQVFLGLANDTGDGDGQPLKAGEHNYLEVYGIPPTLSVLRARFLASAPNPCAQVNLEAIRSVRSVSVSEKTGAPAEGRKEKKAKKDKKGKSEPPAPPPADEASRTLAFAEVEKRLQCEGLFDKKQRHAPGRLDDAMRQALVRFQHKHKLYDYKALRPDTMTMLGHTLLENDHAALVRVLTERAVAAAAVLEDGSATDGDGKPATYKNAAGEQVPVRNMVDEVIQATLTQLGLDTPQGALAFFQRHPAAEFRSLRVGVKMPTPPEYYSPAMDLSVQIDRGSVIYDPPVDENGKPCPFSRRRFPSLVMFVKHAGQRIPLIRLRTTIGGWRMDLASNGYEYYRYKGSDVGPRIWRNIVAGPVWIPPTSSPLRGLVKGKMVNGQGQLVVNYDEVGPGYLSAYGLVAAYNVEPGRDGREDGDNGIRVHGSSEYRSIRNPDGYSHGCHRLMNHLAVRLFSFTLQHRKIHVVGERALGFKRQWLWKDDVYEMRLPTRGYWFELDPPIPVVVLEGDIVGKVKRPINTYVPKPGIEYPPGPIPSPPDGD